MKLWYLFSIFYLMASFLLYKKSDKKMSVVASVIYTICLLFCYNVVVVSVYSFFRINGSLLILSLINYFVGSILNLISFKRKKVQKYFLNKKELVTVFVIVGIVFLVGCFRFRGFTVLVYETGDPAVHYRAAIHFSRELELLNTSNSKDIVFDSFDRMMPISYINCGILMRIFSGNLTYQVFIFFDVFCLLISSLLFFVIIFNVLGKKKYFYSLILTLMYFLGFPLNNLIFGFSYLGLGIMVINLLFLTIYKIKDFGDQKLFKIVLLFMINFGLFFSYYLFMPCIYLSLGIYYIYLWRKKKFSFNNLLLYGGITLIVPFVIGVVYFILPGFLKVDGINIVKAIGIDGYIYNNKVSRYFFFGLLIAFFVRIFRKKEKFSYFNLNFLVISLYVVLFLILYLFDYVSLYYFYKLFYLYWFFAIIFVGNLLLRKREYLYTIVIFIFVGMGIVYVMPNNIFSSFLIKSNIYSWNANAFIKEKILFSKNELELMNESVKYEKLCKVENEFLITGDRLKNAWFYSFTGNVPLYGYRYGEAPHLDNLNISFEFWQSLDEYKCLVYFYEDKKKNYEEDDYEVLYSNKEGAILMKKDR